MKDVNGHNVRIERHKKKIGKGKNGRERVKEELVKSAEESGRGGTSLWRSESYSQRNSP